jgi:hypothetical protein
MWGISCQVAAWLPDMFCILLFGEKSQNGKKIKRPLKLYKK